MRRISARPTRRRGFTLLEVLLVVAILVALAAIALPRLIGVQKGALRDTAKLQVNALDAAFGNYFVNTGAFPTSEQGIAALEIAPTPQPENWNGPYFRGASTLLDPWQKPYNYQYPGQHSVDGPDIWSNGPDGQSGGIDDIGNWPVGQ